jgi:tetratricopeptide (TPR) repeat protein
MAGAEVALGDQVLAAHDLEEALRQFEAARATFARCGDEVRLAESAAYNAATCLLRLDQVLERKGDYAARVENLKRAVEALSAVTDTWPGNARAVKNLDYARYRLALLLQEPPTPEEEKENPEEDDKPVSEVAGATTQIPGATAEVVDGATVVLRVERAGEAVP